MSDLLNSASLVMIPSGYKEDTVYSVVPSDGSGDLSFTRASNGTRINSAGLVEVCPWNLVEQSNTFNTTWVSAGGGATATIGATDPNGGTNGWTLAKSGAGGRIEQTNSVVGQVTLSIIVKQGTLSWVTFTNDVGYRYFNLTNGALGQSDGASTSTATLISNGWYLLTLTTATNGGIFRIYPADGDGNASGTSGNILIFNSAINIGATAKPYFPTTDRLNVPRLTYQNGGGGCPSLLLEKQSTNIATYSEQFDTADWTKIQSSITANSVTSPDGTTNADTFTADGTNNEHQLRSSGLISLVNGTTYTTSIFVKANTNNFVQFVGSGSPYASTTYANFNIATGVVGDVGAGTTAKIENFGNGWYRCSMTATAIATTTTNTFLLNIVTSNTAVRGETNTLATSVYIWGAQLEASSYPTSYILTTSSSATRVADACFKTGISSLIGQSEGVMFLDFEFPSMSSLFSGGTVYAYLYDGSTKDAYIAIYDNGFVQAYMFGGCLINTASGYVTQAGRFKMAFAYKANDFVLYINGVQAGTDTSGTVPTFSQFGLQYINSTFASSQKVNQAAVFKTRLTNAELASLTTI